MTTPSRSLAVAILLVVCVVASIGPASALEVDLTDGGGDSTDADGTSDVSADADVDVDADGTTDASVEASTDGGVEADASVDGNAAGGDSTDGTSVDATAVVDTDGGDVDLATGLVDSDASLDLAANVHLNGPVRGSVAVEAVAEPDVVSGDESGSGADGPGADGGEPTDGHDSGSTGGAEAIDADRFAGIEMEDRSGTSPGSGGLPVDSPAGVGIGVVAGAAVLYRGIQVVDVGPSPVPLRTAAGVLADGISPRVPRLVFPFGYSRYDDSDPLEHDLRAELYDAVETSPGVHLSALDGRTEGSLSTVRHHLRILEEESLVETELLNGKRRYFPAGTADTALIAALDDPPKAAVLRGVAAAEPVTVSDLADSLGRDPSTVSHHLSNLAEADLVEREREGRSVSTRLAAGVRPVVEATATAPGLARAD